MIADLSHGILRTAVAPLLYDNSGPGRPALRDGSGANDPKRSLLRMLDRRKRQANP